MRDEDVVVLEIPELTPAERLYLPQIIGGFRTTLRHLFDVKFRNNRITQYPEQKRTLRVENYRGVHRLNKDPDGRVACVACFMCSTACPAHCIHIEAGESPWPDREKYPIKFDIDELRCIYCGMCEEACPVDAIGMSKRYEMVSGNLEGLIFRKQLLLSDYDKLQMQPIWEAKVDAQYAQPTAAAANKTK